MPPAELQALCAALAARLEALTDQVEAASDATAAFLATEIADCRALAAHAMARIPPGGG